MCGDQESYYAADPCPAQTNGSIAFSGDGPDQNGYENWPLDQGNYKVCVFHDVNYNPYNDDPHVCKSFSLVRPPSSAGIFITKDELQAEVNAYCTAPDTYVTTVYGYVFCICCGYYYN